MKGMVIAMQDEKIVELYWQRDEAAIKETEKKYDRYLTKIAYNILSDIEDSKESVNDTYHAAWKSIPPSRPNILSTYLAKLTRRISIDMFRKKNRDMRRASEYSISLSELGECIPSTDTPENELDAKLLAGAVNSFLRTLSDEARAAFIGRYYFLDPLREVARYCGMSQSKAKSLLYRTRIALREHLEKEGFNV